MLHRVYTGRVRCCTIKLDPIIINYSIKVLSHLPLPNWILQNKLFCQLANKPNLNNCFLNRCFLHLVIVLKYSVMKKCLNRHCQNEHFIVDLFALLQCYKSPTTQKSLPNQEACYWSVLQIVKVDQIRSWHEIHFDIKEICFCHQKPIRQNTSLRWFQYKFHPHNFSERR